jgi:hypothetical protein
MTALFGEVVAALTAAGHPVGSGRMFGCDAITLGGKVAAVQQDGILCCRLGTGTPAHTAALAEPGAALWDPHGNGRLFRDWVALQPDPSSWHRFAFAAVAALSD